FVYSFVDAQERRARVPVKTTVVAESGAAGQQFLAPGAELFVLRVGGKPVGFVVILVVQTVVHCLEINSATKSWQSCGARRGLAALATPAVAGQAEEADAEQSPAGRFGSDQEATDLTRRKQSGM